MGWFIREEFQCAEVPKVETSVQMSTCQTLQFLERSESIVTTQFSDLAHFLPLAGSVYAFSNLFHSFLGCVSTSGKLNKM